MSLVQGIVLNSYPIKENDLFVNLLSKDGIIPFFVFNLTPAKKVLLDEFSFGEYEIRASKGKSLVFESGELSENNHQIKNPDQYYALSLLRELLFKCEQGLEHRDYMVIYHLFLTFNLLVYKDPEKTFTYFLGSFAIFLRLLGYSFNVDGCYKCGERKKIVGYDLSHNGLVCESHFESYTSTYLSKEYVYALRDLFKVDVSSLINLKMSHNISSHLFDDLLYMFNLNLDLKFEHADRLKDRILRKE